MPAVPKVFRTIATQTPGTMMEHLSAFAERSSLTVVELKPIRDQFWDHVLACMKMPRGGVGGGGSMHCSFEFVAASERVVSFLMEDLPLMANHRYNLSLPPLTGRRRRRSTPTTRTRAA